MAKTFTLKADAVAWARRVEADMETGHWLERASAMPATADEAIEPIARYTQPPGRLLSDGQLVCWGNNRDWKDVVFSAFERSRQNPRTSSTAAALIAGGRPVDQENRALVEMRRGGSA